MRERKVRAWNIPTYHSCTLNFVEFDWQVCTKVSADVYFSHKTVTAYKSQGHLKLSLDLDRYVAYHPFTGIGATVGLRSLPGFCWSRFKTVQPTFDGRWYRPGGSTKLLSLGSMNDGIGQCVIRGHSSIYHCSECSFQLGFVTGTCFCLSWSGYVYHHTKCDRNWEIRVWTVKCKPTWIFDTLEIKALSLECQSAEIKWIRGSSK